MERRNARQTREIVVPGDVLDGSGMKPGENAYVMDGKVRASVMGVRNVFQNTVGVIPLRGCYMPTSGDTVIGVIVDIGPSNWLVDIGAPYPAPLHVNEVPWKVEFGDTSRYLNMGQVVLLKVLSVDESKKINVTMKDSGLRRIEGGRLVKISHSKVSRIIGKSGSMISMLKNMTDCRITVGQNGMIWIDGEDENADVATEAVKMIEAQAQSGNLTDRVRAFIEKRLPQEEEDYEEEEE
ncbi:MAG: S1 RNA-binding domain-containing protein [Candidatus Methanomethylophilaceae archaeon]|jgi:exosome complex component RRP4|nr:S1 RNA-binding domain-containing protein [Thermoplasmata archaeon]MBO4349179.1 S1 RNA-binding domain-containing protein [Candidatus Methanomethylophilaceae archaeon]MBR3476377.1 S1 RNA-binding domain-containing protein [Candidatus Methanomethylophilaceae archaeon]MBR4181676.1 S1 RNA-binding domain-containing protein [Candidatus Methanomethylophilaceae archaeon]MBR4216147.1 S1 RNA-binding domain-containing protein [Candidatus Methanomethylophilaceae archaeon]